MTDRNSQNNRPISARRKAYQYIMNEMHRGALLPGNSINLSAIKEELSVSSTPLRDALIRLETEGFLTIYPRSKVVVNVLELQDFPFLYGVIGNIEHTLIISGLVSYTPHVIEELREIIIQMELAINAKNMRLYDQHHYAFHEIFLRQCDNMFAERILSPIKSRLWDLPRRNFLEEWYVQGIQEHSDIVDAIEAKDIQKIEHMLKQVHWNYDNCKEHIKIEYNFI